MKLVQTRGALPFTVEEPNFFLIHYTQQTDPTTHTTVKTATAGLCHCTDQTSMRQAVLKLSDLEEDK